jgi:hypothetical protein
MKYSDDEYRNETLRVLAACDWASGLKLAREEAVEEIARNALKEGVEVSLVSEITGLDEAEIERLRAELMQ